MSSLQFSVIIPAYNRGEAIRTAIASVLAQRGCEFEVVVVDDGSSDDTLAVVEHLDDARLRSISQPNRGPSAARNEGAKIARGEYLVFLDSDDELVANALER